MPHVMYAMAPWQPSLRITVFILVSFLPQAYVCAFFVLIKIIPYQSFYKISNESVLK